MKLPGRLILASKSPRRKAILELVGFNPIVMVSNCDESVVKETDPEKLVAALSKLKANAVTDKCELKDVIVASDTVVSLDGKILGKPKTKKEAVEMLQSLNGRTHEVFTGVTIIYKKKSGDVCDTFVERTPVTFAKMSNCEIHEYVDTGEPMDKAGAYGIQGTFAKFIPHIDGDAFSVAGLPIARTYEHIRALANPKKKRN